MKPLLIIAIVLSAQLSFAQISLKGKVVEENGNALGYCKVGIDGTSIGTLSDESGLFNLEVPEEFEQNNLKISFIGYEDVVLKIIQISSSDNLEIVLKQSEFEIEDVVVTPKEDFSQGKDKENTATTVNFSIGESKNKNLGSEIGKLFKIKEPVLLEEVRFFVDYNNYDSVRLRLNIYAIKNKRPDKNLLSDEIYISFGKTNGEWKSIDVSDYEIVLTENTIITLEWIYGLGEGKHFGLPIIVPSVGSTHYYRFGSQGEWKKFSNMSIPMMINGYYVD